MTRCDQCGCYLPQAFIAAKATMTMERRQRGTQRVPLPRIAQQRVYCDSCAEGQYKAMMLLFEGQCPPALVEPHSGRFGLERV